jgi:hypothetical protein
MELVKFGVCSIPWVHNFGFNNGIGPKKISVVPVSYREKIRVGRSEINIIFFHGFCSFLLGNFQQLATTRRKQVRTVNRIEKIIGSAEKIGSVGKPEPQVFFLGLAISG